MARVKVNGVEVEVADGTNMIEAAKAVGVEIPHYCYHPHLSVAGNCRMCAVEIEAGGRGTEIACNMKARDGLAIRTDSPVVLQLRKSVMEFLLVNHPLDCPICDQAGECRLQDYYSDHGNYESRLTDAKVTKPKRQDIGDLIVLDSERCVQCSRCVRFGDEITGTGELRLFNRGNHTEIGIFPGERLSHQYQGNLADICPVGALTNKDFRFQKRVWYLTETPSVCDGCATGCNIQVCHQDGQVFRYLPRRNDNVNQSWICDTGRASYKRIGGLSRVLKARVDGKTADLQAAISAVVTRLKANPEAVGVVLGASSTNEANWALLSVFRAQLPKARLFTCEGNDPDASPYHDDLLVSIDKNPNTSGVNILAAHAGGVGDRGALFEALKAGELKVLVVLEDDVLGRLGDVPVETLVALSAWRTATANRAAVLLPVSAHVEQEGTYTNRHGRVQRLNAALPPAGDSLPAYRVLEKLGVALGKSPGTDTARGAWKALASAVSAYKGMTYKTIGKQGQQAAVPTTGTGPAATAGGAAQQSA